MFAILSRMFGTAGKAHKSRRPKPLRRRLGESLLAVESLEQRTLLSADAVLTALPADAALQHRAAMVDVAQTTIGPDQVSPLTNAGIAANANDLIGPVRGSFAGTAISDAGPPAPGTSLNPLGTTATGTVSDQGLPAPGTSMNPLGTDGTLTISDAGPPAPGTSMNPLGLAGTVNSGTAASSVTVYPAH